MFSFTATTWGIVTVERRGMNEPIVTIETFDVLKDKSVILNNGFQT